MGLKFRRGTTAQKSGSLAFGEPYVNTDLGTLQIGGATGDITLGASGTGSTGTFGAISGSGLDITGNANVGGNLTIGGQVTIGDNTADTINVVASLSSSLIPQTTNVFDLGSADKIWRDLYISTGSIKIVNPGNGTVVGTLTSNANGDLNVAGALSASTITGLGNATLYSTSVDSRLVAAELFSSSLDSTFATDASVTIVSASAWGAFQSASAYSASIYTRDETQDTVITANSASAAGAFASASAYSASIYTRDETQDTVITANSASAAGAFASASAYSASAVTTYAKLAVENTFTTNQIVSGSITATGDVVAFSTSDKRHKHNIVLISDALGKVTKLNGVTWEWNEDVDSATKETPKTGLIAQEVQEVLPEVVKERADGFLALDYSKMMGLMVEAIKEQQIQIEKLRMDLDNYECKCDNCKSK